MINLTSEIIILNNEKKCMTIICELELAYYNNEKNAWQLYVN